MADRSLLPAEHESVRCSDFARQLAVDPGGTAIRSDLLIAAELPLPWPKPVFAHQAIEGVPEAVAAAPWPSRVLAAVPRLASGVLSVVAFRRHPFSTGVTRREWHTNLDGLVGTITALLTDGTPTDAELSTAAEPAAEVWICTQGSHDLCCGAEGMALVHQVSQRWPDVVVQRVSHTGGHRFAPTAITLPDGRMWGYLDEDALRDIVHRTGDVATLVKRCRGWWGATAGAAQVAERAVFATQGWGWENQVRSTEVVAERDGLTTVRVSTAHGASWLVRVAVGREVPTIACRSPGGLPVKPGREYSVVDLATE